MHSQPYPHAAPRRASPPARAAFTLVELLTVIAIIGVLAAMLTLVVGKVRASAHSAKCVSNLRQLGVATGLYAADNKGEIPYANYYMESNVRATDKLAPYVDVKFPSTAELTANTILPPDPFRCPAADHPAKSGNKSHYGKNFFINSQKGYDTDPRRTGYRLTDIPEPSRYYYLADAVPVSGQPQVSWQIGSVGSNTGELPTSKLGIELRHSGRANILFLDFHVEALTARQIGNWSWNYPATAPWCPRQ